MDQGQGAPDLRDKVEEDRGLIKKIEMAIPGFRGYRKREDLRIADSLLRKQIADSLGKVQAVLEDCRSEMARAMDMANLEEIKKLVNSAETTQNRVRHAEQGYTGISPDYRIDIAELNRMYEWDLSLLTGVRSLSDSAHSLLASIRGGGASADTLRAMTDTLRDFNSTFDRRVEAFTGLQVTD